MVNEPDYIPSWPDGIDDGSSSGIWARNGLAAEEEHPAVDPHVAFTSLAFIGAALKRNARVWCAFALVGLLIGAGLFVKFPGPYQATTSILLKENPNVDPSVAIQIDASLAQSSPVAERVIRQLGLQETVNDLLSSYTVLPVSNNVLLFTVNASSGAAATKLASALGTNFLQYRTSYYRTQQQQTTAELDQQFNQAQKRLNSVDAQIAQLRGQPTSGAQQTELNNLQAQQNNQIQVEQYTNDAKATGDTIAYQMTKYSQVIDGPTSLPHSRKKRVLEDIGAGLLAGLALGLLVVIVQALVSGRLRRRDDIADALGAPVRLSVRSPRRRRWLSGRRRLADLDEQRVVAHLNTLVPRRLQGPAALAVVTVENAEVVAPAIVSLALRCALQGKRVVVSDLSGGAVADLLGVADPGVHAVQVDGQRLIAAFPERDDVSPAGPLQARSQNSRTGEAQIAQASQALLTACASADLLIVAASLDPSLYADYLGTWSTDAVAVVTAGLSSGTRIRAVADMIRLAGVRLNSAVLIGADKDDESLGAVSNLDQPVQV